MLQSCEKQMRSKHATQFTSQQYKWESNTSALLSNKLKIDKQQHKCNKQHWPSNYAHKQSEGIRLQSSSRAQTQNHELLYRSRFQHRKKGLRIIYKDWTTENLDGQWNTQWLLCFTDSFAEHHFPVCLEGSNLILTLRNCWILSFGLAVLHFISLFRLWTPWRVLLLV